MSSIINRRLIAVGITAAAVAVSGAPSAQASKKSERKQNSAIRKVAKAGKKINSKANAARDLATAASNAASDAKNAAATADKKGTDAGAAAASAQATINAILAQVPTITDALTKLADGLTQAGAGLTTLKNAYLAPEYGVVKVQLNGTDIPGMILTSADIPDDSNATVVSGTMAGVLPAGATPGSIRLLAGIRSGESDGTGTGLATAAGQAGLVSMTVTDPSSGLGLTGGSGLPGFPLTDKPNAAYGGAPVYEIALKAPRVDATPNPLSFPTDKTTDLTDPTRLASGAPYATANAVAGTPIVVTVTVRFHDLGASAEDVTA